MVIEARKMGMKRCIIPYDNMNEANVVDGISIIGVLYQLHQSSHLIRNQLLSQLPNYMGIDVKLIIHNSHTSVENENMLLFHCF